MAKEFGTKSEVQHLIIAVDQAGRRIDNFLVGALDGIPRTRIYQMLRKGEVRVNRSRVKPDYRISAGDQVRIPPVWHTGQKLTIRPTDHLHEHLENCILYEDEYLIVLDKPAGIAVHGGSGQRIGIIETLKYYRPQTKCLELVHRLDKSTSGCLLLAKDHRLLRELHNRFRQNTITKQYIALLKGRIQKSKQIISIPLHRSGKSSGERRVKAQENGKQSETQLILVRHYQGASLVHANLYTGRTHQIRVHAAHIGHPVAGDEKYGDREFNRRMKRYGLRRMFLHADSIILDTPYYGKKLAIHAPLPDALEKFLGKIS